ncbi:MAG: hypothetical protein M1816_005105 [Peltula sp. TS41687]|nr:MAG: hypothetical protein M1816_005105 [Peltula sp. TS41687]
MGIRKGRAPVTGMKSNSASGGYKKRSLNALAIASRQTAQAQKTKAGAGQKRKWEAEEKSSRMRDDDDDVVDHGSDSDGNEWRLGEVGSGEDSEIDSDDAFGESDEERFEGFSFGGSSKRKKTPKWDKTLLPSTTKDVETYRSESSGSGSTDHSDQDDWSGLGEDDAADGAMDIAILLDDPEPEPKSSRTGGSAGQDVDTDSNGSTSESESGQDTDSVLSVSEDEQERKDPAKLSALQDLIHSINPGSSERPTKRRRVFDGLESSVPSDFGITSARKLTVEDLLPSITDADMKRSLRLIASGKGSRDSRKRSGVPGKLEPPVAKRQQDRLDRTAAYAKSKETLERWIDTIKYNRRAEHLSFPLATPASAGGEISKSVLPRVGTAVPNELEATIQDILHQSGLNVRDGKSEEQNIQKMEELQAKRLSLEEVQARRAQLRMARELLFREEVRAKRIKKIKSKAYRRVHRKERERADRDTKAALVAGGLVDSEEEQELNDKRRAEERMGARHRESRWAKQVKVTGRQKWIQDARSGIVETAMREEALKKRIEGKSSGRVDGSGDTSSSDGELDTEGSDDEDHSNPNGKLFRRLDALDGQQSTDAHNEVGFSRLNSLKFMQRADAARKLENDTAVQQLKRELEGEESTSGEEQVFEVGRRKYQPKTGATSTAGLPVKDSLNDFEERLSDEENAGHDDSATRPEDGPLLNATERIQENRGSSRNGPTQGTAGINATNVRVTPGKTISVKKGPIAPPPGKQAILTANSVPNKTTSKKTKGVDGNAPKQNATSRPRESALQSNPNQWKSVTLEDADASSDVEGSETEAPGLQVATLAQDELRLRAFAGDDVEESFRAEKEDAVRDEGDQIIDNTLPGWGHWIGDGISKREQKRHKGKFLTKVEGVKKEKRTDAKLDNVILSEKRIKKNAKYLASTLPHPFENRQQYERSLRIPMGPEWTTKETFNDATKPRILLKQGIIAAMQNPFL